MTSDQELANVILLLTLNWSKSILGSKVIQIMTLTYEVYSSTHPPPLLLGLKYVVINKLVQEKVLVATN